LRLSQATIKVVGGLAAPGVDYPLVLTDRDQEIVRWLGELGAAAAADVGVRFGMGRSWCYRRLQVLVTDGLLVERRLLHRQPGLYLASAEGLRWTGLQRLGVFRVGAGGFEHARELGRVAAELHRLRPGATLLSERTIRAAENETGELIASARVGQLPGGRVALHRPDLAIRSESGGMTAIEVELSVKAPRRLEAICRGYARARHLDRVAYLATPAAARAVSRAVAAIRAEEKIVAYGLEDIEEVARDLELG
jgi:hypothetical protein